MSENFDSALTYTSYLAVDELLKLQRPLSTGPEHDEMLFIIIHQTYELWFKQLIHEFQEAQRAMESGDSHYSLAILGRIRTILKVCVTQIDILETMTPLQFNAFRSYLSSSSGFQSAQFRMVEALLGRRDSKMAGHLPLDIQERIKEITTRLVNAVTGARIPGSGSAVSFRNGGYQVSYNDEEEISRSRVGDRVRMCLVTIPEGCPRGDTRGFRYTTTNLRTRDQWTLPDSPHSCGGA